MSQPGMTSLQKILQNLQKKTPKPPKLPQEILTTYPAMLSSSCHIVKLSEIVSCILLVTLLLKLAIWDLSLTNLCRGHRT